MCLGRRPYAGQPSAAPLAKERRSWFRGTGEAPIYPFRCAVADSSGALIGDRSVQVFDSPVGAVRSRRVTRVAYGLSCAKSRSIPGYMLFAQDFAAFFLQIFRGGGCSLIVHVALSPIV